MMLVEIHTRKDVTDAQKARSSISVHFRNVCAFDFEFTFPFIHPSNKNLEKSNGNDKPPKHISEMNRGDEIKSAKNGQREGGEGEFFVTCSTTNASVLGNHCTCSNYLSIITQ